MIDSYTRDAMVHQAIQLESIGRLAEAALVYERLLTLDPSEAVSWFNLGILRRKLREYDAALAAYQRAIEHGITRAEEAHVNRGVIYSDCLRQPDSAAAELRAALSINPAYIPALLNLANLHEDRGDRQQAVRLYEQILEINPARHEALARLANCRNIADENDPLIARLRAAIADGSASSADRASLGFALGKALDSCGAYAKAFAAYTEANQASRESAAGGANYARGAQEHLVAQIIEAFPAHRVRAKTGRAVRPIFICGMFRSGSTLIEQVLSMHSNVIAGGELDFVPTLVQSLLMPFPAAAKTAPNEKFDQLAGFYLEALDKLFPGDKRVTDKRPDNFLYIGVIKSLFPDALIVHTVRDPLDTCLSNFFLHLDHRMSYALDLRDLGHYYNQYRRLMRHWEQLYGNDILRFDYDRFVRAPRAELESLLNGLGLPWEEACLSPHQSSVAVRTASVWQVREPINTRSLGRWKNYADFMHPLREALEQEPNVSLN